MIAEEEVKTTDPPSQKVVDPPAEIIGVAGVRFTLTNCGADDPDEQPLVTIATVYVPEDETVMDCVVAPVDQTLFVKDEEVNTTELPEQNVVGPPAVMVGTDGVGFTVITVGDEVAEQRPLLTVTE